MVESLLLQSSKTGDSFLNREINISRITQPIKNQDK